MPDSQTRKALAVGRRETKERRSVLAYGSHARGVQALASGERMVRFSQGHGGGLGVVKEDDATDWTAAAALALVYPLARRLRRALGSIAKRGNTPPSKGGIEGARCMKKKPSIRSLETLSLDEALAYVEYASGDELSAACALAWDRNRLDGSIAAPDDAEVHHAFFLLCRARGMDAPSFDEMRVELRRRLAA